MTPPTNPPALPEGKRGPGWGTVVLLVWSLLLLTYATFKTDVEHDRSIKQLEDCVRRLEEHELRNLSPYPVSSPEAPNADR